MKNYRIFRNVINEDLVELLLIHGHKYTQPVFRSGYDADEVLGTFKGSNDSGTWRKHNTALLTNPLKIELNKQILSGVSFDNIYPAVKPDIGVDTMVNRYEVGHFALNHIDPPTSIWDNRGLKRRANFSCMLSNQYTGGEVIVDGTIVEETLNPGDILVFAQPQPHQVSQILTGRRIVAFGWIYDTGIDNAE